MKNKNSIYLKCVNFGMSWLKPNIGKKKQNSYNENEKKTERLKVRGSD